MMTAPEIETAKRLISGFPEQESVEKQFQMIATAHALAAIAQAEQLERIADNMERIDEGVEVLRRKALGIP